MIRSGTLGAEELLAQCWRHKPYYYSSMNERLSNLLLLPLLSAVPLREACELLNAVGVGTPSSVELCT